MINVESVQSTLVRHQRRDKRKQIETNVIFAGGTYTSRHNVYKNVYNISKQEANEKKTGNGRVYNFCLRAV